MHERGVCGCPVIFPDLIKPRLIVPSTPMNPTLSSNSSAPIANNTVEKDRHNDNGKATTKQGLSNRNGGHRKKKKSTIPQDNPQIGGCNKIVEGSAEVGQSSLNQSGGKHPEISKKLDVRERPGVSQQVGNATGHNIPAAVPARIHSLYGAEWIEEHRQLHNAGSCRCAADFSCYQTPEVYGITDSSHFGVNNEQGQTAPMAAPYSPPYHAFQDAVTWGQSLGCSSHPAQASSDGYWSQNTQHSQQFQDHHPYRSYEPCFPSGQPSHFYQGAQADAWSTAHQVCPSFILSHHPSNNPESPCRLFGPKYVPDDSLCPSEMHVDCVFVSIY